MNRDTFRHTIELAERLRLFQSWSDEPGFEPTLTDSGREMLAVLAAALPSESVPPFIAQVAEAFSLSVAVLA